MLSLCLVSEGMEARLAAMRLRSAEIEAQAAAIERGEPIAWADIAAQGKAATAESQLHLAEIRAGTATHVKEYTAALQRHTAALQARTAAIQNASPRQRRTARKRGTRNQWIAVAVVLALFGGCAAYVQIKSRGHTFNDCYSAVGDLETSVIAYRNNQQDVADPSIELASLKACDGASSWKIAADSQGVTALILQGSGLMGAANALTAICTEADPHNHTTTCAER